MAFIRVTCSFLRPLKIIDQIHDRSSVLEKRYWKRWDKGVVVFGLEILN
jgi:hypothetical protein